MTQRLLQGARRKAVGMGVVISVALGSADMAAAKGDLHGEQRTQIIAGSKLNAAPDKAVTRRAKRAFLAENAAAGQLYDDNEVSSGTIGGVTAVWSDSVGLAKVMVTSLPDDTSHRGVAGLGSVGTNDPNTADQRIARLGSESLDNLSGQWGSRDGGTVQVTVKGFRLVSGWERYRIRESKYDREVYYYGHWATAYGKSVTGYDPAPYVVDVRSRPKDGYRSRFLQLRNYWPKTSTPSCSGGDIGISVLGFGGNLPLQNCESISPRADANSITMKVVWSAGLCKDSTVEGADLGMAVDTKRGVKAILSDYSYARFNPGNSLTGSSSKCNVTTGDDVRAIYTDPGW